jgi:hypothetical protein
LIHERPLVHGAPEQCEYRGYRDEGICPRPQRAHYRRSWLHRI